MPSPVTPTMWTRCLPLCAMRARTSECWSSPAAMRTAASRPTTSPFSAPPPNNPRLPSATPGSIARPMKNGRSKTSCRTPARSSASCCPKNDPVVAGFRISGTNLPARIISGDYYDYLDLGDHKFGIAIADVSGKGVPAGLLMAMCRSALRSVAPGRTSPSEVLAAVNRQLFPGHPRGHVHQHGLRHPR